MISSLRLLWLLSTWIVNTTSSISTFYHRISNRRGIPVKVFRKFESLSYKLSKKSLDKEFFVTCLHLQICPEFLKFKTPKLKTYANTKDIYQQVARKQLLLVGDVIASTKSQWVKNKQKLHEKLSFWRKFA